MLEVDATGNAQAIAQKHGVREKTLRWWCSELRRRARTRGSSPRLLPVVVKTPKSQPPVSRSVHAAVVASTALEVLVELGAARITLRGAVTAEHVAAIVSSC